MEEMSLSEYSERVGISEEELTGKSRKRNLTIPRFVYWFYLNKLNPVEWSSAEIAFVFGRESQAIRYGIKQVRNFIETNDAIIEPYRKDYIEPFLHQDHSN